MAKYFDRTEDRVKESLDSLIETNRFAHERKVQHTTVSTKERLDEAVDRAKDVIHQQANQYQR